MNTTKKKFSTTLTYLINVEYGINEEGRQNFLLCTSKMKGGWGQIHFCHMKKGRGWSTKSGKTISETPRLLDR